MNPFQIVVTRIYPMIEKLLEWKREARISTMENLCLKRKLSQELQFIESTSPFVFAGYCEYPVWCVYLFCAPVYLVLDKPVLVVGRKIFGNPGLKNGSNCSPPMLTKLEQFHTTHNSTLPTRLADPSTLSWCSSVSGNREWIYPVPHRNVNWSKGLAHKVQ